VTADEEDEVSTEEEDKAPLCLDKKCPSTVEVLLSDSEEDEVEQTPKKGKKFPHKIHIPTIPDVHDHKPKFTPGYPYFLPEQYYVQHPKGYPSKQYYPHAPIPWDLNNPLLIILALLKTIIPITIKNIMTGVRKIPLPINITKNLTAILIIKRLVAITIIIHTIGQNLKQTYVGIARFHLGRDFTFAQLINLG